MTYVGATPTTGDFKKLDAITASATATYNLRQGGVAVFPQSSSHCLVVLNGILQTGGSSFNIVNDTIVFAEALTSSDVINQILVLGNVNDIGVPSDDTVSTAKIQADAINATKIADDSISDEHLDITAITGQTAITSLADTDKFLVSDASDSGNLKYVENQYLGGGTHVKLLSGSVSSATNHDFENFVDTSKYNYYLVQISNALNMGTFSPFSFQARTSGGVHTGSNYSFASYGYRSSGNITNNYGENQGRALLGSAITGVANKPSGLMFYLVVNPASNSGGTHGWGINWGWNTTNSDIQWENFSYMVEYTGTTTGFRLYADSNNATTFDYAIYGIAK